MNEYGKAHKKLNKEAFINTIIVSCSIALFVMFITAFTIWFIGSKIYYVAFIIFTISLTITLPITYTKLKPNNHTIALRLDNLGLYERMITMEQFKDDKSFIAEKQREDAIKSLHNCNLNKLKSIVSIPLTIICTTAFILGGGMTTVSALTATGHIKSGSDIINDIDDANKSVYEVKYSVEAREYSQDDFLGGISMKVDTYDDRGGEIIGEVDQLVSQGEDATEVTAIEYEDYVFYAWSDGVQSPTRTDLNVQGNINLTAIFVKMEEGDGDGKGDGKPSDGEPSEREPKDQEPNDSNNNGKDDTDLDNTASTDSRNQVLNGKTYYGGKNYDEARNEASDKTSQNGNMPSDMKDLINDYFEAIKKN